MPDKTNVVNNTRDYVRLSHSNANSLTCLLARGNCRLFLIVSFQRQDWWKSVHCCAKTQRLKSSKVIPFLRRGLFKDHTDRVLEYHTRRVRLHCRWEKAYIDVIIQLHKSGQTLSLRIMFSCIKHPESLSKSPKRGRATSCTRFVSSGPNFVDYDASEHEIPLPCANDNEWLRSLYSSIKILYLSIQTSIRTVVETGLVGIKPSHKLRSQRLAKAKCLLRYGVLSLLHREIHTGHPGFWRSMTHYDSEVSFNSPPLHITRSSPWRKWSKPKNMDTGEGLV
jgi:hypothetical protein